MKKYFGDKVFYKTVFTLVVPMIIQSAITNFVNLVDNLMVGGLGTESIAAVAVTNQLFMVFNLLIFGGTSAAGIFTAQFFGHGDDAGVKNTFRFKLWFSVIAVSGAIFIFIAFADGLIGAFMTESADGGDIALAASLAKGYLFIMLVGLPAFALTSSYTSTMKETNKTFLPMVSGVIAVCVNVVLNYVLIFGKFGAPKLGVSGAAIATVLARYVEAIIAMSAAHFIKNEYGFAKGIYKKITIPKTLVMNILRKGLPLICNEVLWSMSMTLINQSYSTRGLAAVAGFNIANTIINLFSIVFFTVGNAVSILVGQQLGAGDPDGAVDTDRKLIVTAIIGGIIMGVLMSIMAPAIVRLYKTEEATKEIARQLMWVAAMFFPLYAFNHSSYFTMRCGGKTFITFLFDSVFTFAVSFPVAFFVSRYTNLPMIRMYMLVESTNFIKAAIGSVLLKKRVWVNNIIS